MSTNNIPNFLEANCVEEEDLVSRRGDNEVSNVFDVSRCGTTPYTIY